jgi:ABC-type sulfate transport system permease component
MDNFTIGGFAWRIAFALAMVLLTFNPAGYSYFHWIREGFPAFTPAQAVVGIVSWGWLDVRNATTMTWVVLVALGLILGVGMSWAIVRRELTGQASVDEIDDNR